MQHVGLKVRMLTVGAILFALYVAAAGVAMELFGVGIAPIVAVGLVALPIFQYKFGKWAALRSVGAVDLPEDRFREIHRTVESLSREMGIEKPRLMYAEMGVPNAFATGRRGAGVVVISAELLAILDRDELEGVIAHELAHIKNRDVVTMVLGQSVASVVGLTVYYVIAVAGRRNIGAILLGWVGSIVANVLVTMLVMVISRHREYVADADAAEYVGSGEPLARALAKISRTSSGRESRLDDSVSALCIFNGNRGLLQRLLATHPPVEKRIERLRY